MSMGRFQHKKHACLTFAIHVNQGVQLKYMTCSVVSMARLHLDFFEICTLFMFIPILRIIDLVELTYYHMTYFLSSKLKKRKCESKYHIHILNHYRNSEMDHELTQIMGCIHSDHDIWNIVWIRLKYNNINMTNKMQCP